MKLQRVGHNLATEQQFVELAFKSPVCIMIVTRNVVLKPKDRDFMGMQKKNKFSSISKYSIWGFPGSSAGKETTCNVGDLGSIPGLGRSLGEGNTYALQYPGLENSRDCIVLGVAKSRTQLGNFHTRSM